MESFNTPQRTRGLTALDGHRLGDGAGRAACALGQHGRLLEGVRLDACIAQGEFISEDRAGSAHSIGHSSRLPCTRLRGLARAAGQRPRTAMITTKQLTLGDDLEQRAVGAVGDCAVSDARDVCAQRSVALRARRLQAHRWGAGEAGGWEAGRSWLVTREAGGGAGSTCVMESQPGPVPAPSAGDKHQSASQTRAECLVQQVEDAQAQRLLVVPAAVRGSAKALAAWHKCKSHGVGW